MTGSMTRRAATALLLAGGSVLAAAPARSAETKVTPKVGMFTISMHSSFDPIPKTLQVMNFWFPMPFEDAHQKIYQRVIAGPYSTQTAELPDHTGVVTYMEAAPRGGLPL